MPRLMFWTPLDRYFLEVTPEDAPLETIQGQAEEHASQGVWIDPHTYLPPQAIRAVSIVIEETTADE